MSVEEKPKNLPRGFTRRVADAAGVSPETVAKVLKQRGAVAHNTMIKVSRAADKLRRQMAKEAAQAGAVITGLAA